MLAYWLISFAQGTVVDVVDVADVAAVACFSRRALRVTFKRSNRSGQQGGFSSTTTAATTINICGGSSYSSSCNSSGRQWVVFGAQVQVDRSQVVIVTVGFDSGLSDVVGAAHERSGDRVEFRVGT